MCKFSRVMLQMAKVSCQRVRLLWAWLVRGVDEEVLLSDCGRDEEVRGVDEEVMRR